MSAAQIGQPYSFTPAQAKDFSEALTAAGEMEKQEGNDETAARMDTLAALFAYCVASKYTNITLTVAVSND